MPIPTRFEIDPSAVGHDPRNGFWAAVSARLAYEDESTVRAATSGWGFDTIDFMENTQTDTQAYVAENDKLAVVAFRGTKEMKDFETDASFSQIAYGGDRLSGKAHDGFKDAFDSIWNKISGKILCALNSGKDIIISGHSLGGALSLLLAAKLLDLGYDPSRIRLYTFGQPRTVDEELAAQIDDALGDRYLRYVQNCDAVPSIPLRSMQNYRHCGQQYYLQSNNRLTKNPPSWQRQKDRLAGIVAGWKSLNFLKTIDDHKMDGYVESMAMNMHVTRFRLDSPMMTLVNQQLASA